MQVEAIVEFDNSQLVSRIWKVGLAVFRNYALGMREEIRSGGSGGESDVYARALLSQRAAMAWLPLLLFELLLEFF